MYLILKRNVVPKPKNGWGKLPGDNNIGLADDIERIHHYRNLVCHSDASGIETVDFNKSVLDLVGVICCEIIMTWNINLNAFRCRVVQWTK